MTSIYPKCSEIFYKYPILYMLLSGSLKSDQIWIEGPEKLRSFLDLIAITGTYNISIMGEQKNLIIHLNSEEESYNIDISEEDIHWLTCYIYDPL